MLMYIFNSTLIYNLFKIKLSFIKKLFYKHKQLTTTYLYFSKKYKSKNAKIFDKCGKILLFTQDFQYLRKFLEIFAEHQHLNHL